MGRIPEFAEFLYRDGRTFFFGTPAGVVGFVPDCGVEPDSFHQVVESVQGPRGVPLAFLVRNTVMTSRPEGFRSGTALTEGFARLKEQPDDETPRDARQFLAGYRLGYDRGYVDGMSDGTAESGAEEAGLEDAADEREDG